MAVLIPAAPAGAAVCSVAGTPVRFPPYDPIAAHATTATGSLTISCQSKTAVAVAMSRGSAPSFFPRTMRGPGTLVYQLYVAPGGAVFGDGTGGSLRRTLSAGPAGAELLFYGVIPARQSTLAGAYGDTISVTIEF